MRQRGIIKMREKIIWRRGERNEGRGQMGKYLCMGKGKDVFNL